MSLEDRLRGALRRTEPERDLTADVMARLGDSPVARARNAGPRRWALAASLLLVAGTGLLVQQYRVQARQEAAGRQLAQALELTSRELENVHRRLELKFQERGT